MLYDFYRGHLRDWGWRGLLEVFVNYSELCFSFGCFPSREKKEIELFIGKMGGGGCELFSYDLGRCIWGRECFWKCVGEGRIEILFLIVSDWCSRVF